MAGNGNRPGSRQLAAVILGILFVTVLHYTTPTSKPLYHEVYNRLYYIPIILGAFYYGLRGGITVSLVVSLLFIPHIMVDWGGLLAGNYNMVAEIFLYIVVGAVTGFLVSSERRYREKLEETGERLKESLSELEEKTDLLVQRENELRQSERLSLLGEISAIMAHEVRNPLGSIKGAAEILSDSFKESDEGYRYTTILEKEVDRLNEVVDNFIRVGSMGREQHVPVAINELIEDLLFFMERFVAQKGVDVRSDLAPGLRSIDGNPNLLRQAFLNLILNAVNAMREGGLLTITTSMADDNIEIRFSDTGEGIPEEAMTRLFEPFFTTRDSGTGLGLSITKRIIEEHGGKIAIESEVGTGTTVKLYLKY
jgi:signal transduction histidine kinase